MTAHPTMRLEVVEVKPIANRTVTAMVRHDDGRCELESVEIADYPPNPNAERLRMARLRAGFNLDEAARMLDVATSTLSGLERGSHAFLLDGYEIAIELFDHGFASSMSVHTRGCKIPPVGWVCTREEGHDGPCAASPVGPIEFPGVICPICGKSEGSVACKRSLKPHR